MNNIHKQVTDKVHERVWNRLTTIVSHPIRIRIRDYPELEVWNRVNNQFKTHVYRKINGPN